MENKQEKPKKNIVEIFFDELSRSSFIFILFAIFTGLVIGGILAAATARSTFQSAAGGIAQ